MLMNISSCYRRFKYLYDEHSHVQNHVHTSCIDYMVFETNCVLREKFDETISPILFESFVANKHAARLSLSPTRNDYLLQKLFHERCLDEIRQISTVVFNQSDVSALMDKMNDMLTRLRHKNKVNIYLCILGLYV